MAQAPQFTPPYNFNDSPIVSPSELQATIMEIEATATGLRNNQVAVIRDDGKINDDVVEFNSLTDSAITQLSNFIFTDSSQVIGAISTDVSALKIDNDQNKLDISNIQSSTASNGQDILLLQGQQLINTTSLASVTALAQANKVNSDQVPTINQEITDIEAFLAANSSFSPNGLSIFQYDPVDFSDGDMVSFDSISGNFVKAIPKVQDLTLSLGGSEVSGSAYTSLSNAINYAKTRLNHGGMLTINVPDGVFIETTKISLDEALKLTIIGNSTALSIIDFQTGTGVQFLSSNTDFSMSNVTLRCLQTYSGNPDTVFINGGSASIRGKVESSDGRALAVTSRSKVDITDAEMIGSSSGELGATVHVSRQSIIEMDRSSILNNSTSGGFALVLSGQSNAVLTKASINSNSISFGGTGGIGVKARDNSTCLIAITGSGASLSFDGSESIQYDPVENTLGNARSIIITSQ